MRLRRSGDTRLNRTVWAIGAAEPRARALPSAARKGDCAWAPEDAGWRHTERAAAARGTWLPPGAKRLREETKRRRRRGSPRPSDERRSRIQSRAPGPRRKGLRWATSFSPFQVTDCYLGVRAKLGLRKPRSHAEWRLIPDFAADCYLALSPERDSLPRRHTARRRVCNPVAEKSPGLPRDADRRRRVHPAGARSREVA
jgi:hypothetical protein